MKFEPTTVRVKPGLPEATLAGERDVIAGAFRLASDVAAQEAIKRAEIKTSELALGFMAVPPKVSQMGRWASACVSPTKPV